jgi:hypothetical protein
MKATALTHKAQMKVLKETKVYVNPRDLWGNQGHYSLFCQHHMKTNALRCDKMAIFAAGFLDLRHTREKVDAFF